MAKVVTFDEAQGLEGMQLFQVYNAMDTIATRVIDDALDLLMTDSDKRTHDFYMALQGPAFEMTMRGMAVNPFKRAQLIKTLKKEFDQLERDLKKHPQIAPIWDKTEVESGACMRPTRKDGKHNWPRGVADDDPAKVCKDCGAKRIKLRTFKPSSDDDLAHLFYDLWKVNPVLNKDGRVTTDKEAKRQIKERDLEYTECVELIERFADVAKQHGFIANFKAPDGRFHSSFNVSVTKTHRWASKKDNLGRGGNAQNITEKHRYIFEADRGKMLVYADLKQAESNVIAHVSGDENYIEAHAEGDTHTFVCRLVWPEGVGGKTWTGDIPRDKVIAQSARPPWDDKEGHDYRFQSKAVQHGSNLGLSSYGLARQKKIPQSAAIDAQGRYFRAFPGIQDYQKAIRATVEAQDPIVTPLGIRFKLFGRPWDEHTFKQGLATIPQATVGHIISIGIYRIWTQLPEVELLAQVHDALVFQVPEGRYDLVYDALQCMTVPIKIKGLDGKTRTMRLGTEAAVGQNWGHYNDNEKKGMINLEGVREITFKSRDEWSIH